MFGTPLIIRPRQVTRSAKSTASPSTVNGISPNTERLNPVAVTTTSASSSSPEPRRMPFSVNSAIVSVAIEALPVPDGGEEVAVGHDRDALLPRAVARGEVLLDVVALGQQGPDRPPSRNACSSSGAVSEVVGQPVVLREVLATQDLVRPLRREVQRLQHGGELVGRRRGDEVGRRALQHRHVRRRLRHRGHQRRRGRRPSRSRPRACRCSRGRRATAAGARSDPGTGPCLPTAAGRACRGCSSPGTSTGSRR